MRKLFLIFLFFVIHAAIFGQNLNIDSIFEPRLSGEIFHIKARTIGSQFYNDDWARGDIKLGSGEIVHNKQLKLNVLLDELIWLPEDSFRFVKLEKHFIDDFWFANYYGRDIHFKKIKFKLMWFMDSSEIYVEDLYQGVCSLFVFRNVIIQGSSMQTEEGLSYSIANLVKEPEFILILPDKNTVTFKKIRRRALLKVLPDVYKVQVKDIIRQHHFTLSSEKDLMAIVMKMH